MQMRRQRPLRIVAATACALTWTGAALAHPHVFIDAGIEVIIDDQNRATGLRISWTYDDYYSLFIIGDKGLDADWDGKLTEAERASLSGFDMGWVAGFAGDTYALQGDAELALSGPKDWTADYQGNRITSTHLRMFAAPVALGADPLIVQVYDPGFYTAYTIVRDTILTGGSGCAATVYAPDVTEADEALKAALSEYSASDDVEQDYPAIGKVYSEEVRVSCQGA
jgi:ABC-type uncharacterized transport system substrate-binding protein